MKSKPAWTLQHYEQQLASENGRLGALAIHDLTINAVLSLSIEDLESDDERLFAFLGLLPRNHFALVEAAAIWQRPISQAEDALERLADVQLIQPEDRSGTNWIGEVWFEIHDLVRLFAAQQLDLPADSAVQEDVRKRVESIGGFYTFAFVKSIEGPEESWREAIQIYEEIVEKLRLLGISEPAAELPLPTARCGASCALCTGKSERGELG